MKFFLDTANLDEIRDVASTGILDGITTNPTLISKEGNSFEDQLLKICSIVKIFNNYEFKAEVLVASVRHPIHVVQAGLVGADICTMPAKVFEQLMKHPLTDKGIAQFLKDWEKVPVIK